MDAGCRTVTWHLFVRYKYNQVSLRYAANIYIIHGGATSMRKNYAFSVLKVKYDHRKVFTFAQFRYKLMTSVFKTNNRLMVTIHSKDVPEILTLYRRTIIDFPLHFLDRLMHSFPMMYNTMGSKLDGLAGRGHFLQKIAS